MKSKMTLFVGALCFFMLTGLKQSIAQDVQNVQVGIYFPYNSNYNEWDITLTNSATGESYEFLTNSTTAATNILGTVPAGRYNIFFRSNYFPAGFDFGVTSTDFYHYEVHYGLFTFYGAPIDATTCIFIDAGY